MEIFDYFTKISIKGDYKNGLKIVSAKRKFDKMQNLKQTFRIILKNKRRSLLLLFSLSVGLTAYLLISAKVFYNKSYDSHFADYKDIYRIVSSTYTNNVLTISQPRTQRILGQKLKESYPEIKESGYLCGTIENHYKIGNNSFTDNNGFHCSNGFLKLFSIEIAHGNNTDLLTKPYTAIISKSFAKKYFKNEDPVGKIIQQYPGFEFEIEAVFNDFPVNTHITPDFLISFHDNMHLPPPLKDNWGEFAFYTYLKVDANADIKKLENDISQLSNDNNSNKASDTEYKFRLQAIKNIHTKSQLANEISKNIRGDYLNILQLISIFILIVAGFNYIYFSYTRISNISVQFGVKKALGAKNSELFSLFLTESLIIHLTALILSIASILLFQQLSDVIIRTNYFTLLPIQFWLSLFSVVIASSFLNPVVLLFMLSRKNSLTLLTKRLESYHNTFSFRQIFTVSQFMIIIFLISSIIGINKQVSFLKTKDKGIDIYNKLVIKTPSHLRRNSNRINNLDAFEQEITKISGVENIAISSSIPGDILGFNFNASIRNNSTGIKTATFVANNDFIASYKIELIAGKGFGDNGNNRGCIINTTCMKQLGYKNPTDLIGKKLYLKDESGLQNIEDMVVGVCKDFNFSSAKEIPNPTVLMDWTENMLWGKYTLSFNQNVDKAELLSQVNEQFMRTFPNYSFEYFWDDDIYNKQFDEENSIISSLKNFAFLAILLGVLSLLSMVWYESLSRTKEIGIRKVNGAKQIDIIKLLNRNFMKWIGIAAIIAVPLSWYFLSIWQNSFAYKASINIWIFLISSSIALIIGLITVTFQSLKSANINPVDSLKYE